MTHTHWAVALLVSMPLLATAQATPQLTYRSAFADYKPYQDVPLADWRAVNDAVMPATKPAQQSGQVAAPAPAAAPAPDQPPGHGMHRPPPHRPMHKHKHGHGGQP